MAGISRRRVLAAGLPVVAMLFGGRFVSPALAASDKKVIKITARRFEFNPSRIVVQKGEDVILELTSVDRLHGFHIPDLDIRTDIVPGKTERVVLRVEKVGEHRFLCDLFCGQGHGKMTGKIVVVA